VNSNALKVGDKIDKAGNITGLSIHGAPCTTNKYGGVSEKAIKVSLQTHREIIFQTKCEATYIYFFL